MNKLPSDWQIKTLNEVCFPSSSNITYKDVKDKKGNYPIFWRKRYRSLCGFLF